MPRLPLGRLLRRSTGAVPLTARGALIALLAGFAFRVYGYGVLDLVAFALGGAGIVLVGLCALSVVAAALWLRRRVETRGLTFGTLEAGALTSTGFSMPSLAHLPLIQLRWEWSAPPGIACNIRGGGERLREEITAAARGETSRIERRFTVEDAFGLARVSWSRSERAPLVILPDTGRLRSNAVVRSLAGAEGYSHPSGAPEGDRMEIRRYAPGDSVRHILWKSYARTRQLNVRLQERSVERSRRTIAYLVSAPGDEAAAAAARVALEGGALGEEWTFGADGTPEPTDGLESALRAIARSGAPDVREVGPAAGLAAFLTEAGGGGIDCVVFAPARLGSWIGTAAAAARETNTGLSFVLGTDGVLQEAADPPLWERLLYTRDAESGTPAGALSAVLRELGARGTPVQVVDRPSGRSSLDRELDTLRLSA